MRTRARRSLLLLAASLTALVLAAPAAHGAFGIQSFDALVLDGPQGAPGTEFYEEAGGHPYVGITDFTVNTLPGGAPDGNVENIRVDVPAGLMTNPESVPRCTDAQIDVNACPHNSQIGVEQLHVVVSGIPLTIRVPLYNMTTADMPESEGGPSVARFAFNPAQAATIPGLPAPLVTALSGLHHVDIVGGVRWQSDYGTFFTIKEVPLTAPLVRTKLTFWGTPADASHATERGRSCVAGAIIPIPDPGLCGGGGQPSTADLVPLLTNPTLCAGVKLETKLTLDSYAGEVATASSFTPTTSNGGEGPQNCDAVPFSSGVDLVPDTFKVDTPTGPLVQVDTPQDGLLTQGAIATSHVDQVSMTLPPGLTMNPSAANGLEACTDAQLAMGTSDPITCPAASDLGTMTIDTPLLADPLEGTIYLGQPLAGDQYRLFLTAAGNGVSVRLKGSILPDPNTGQLTTVFPNNPQSPFDSITLDFRDGPLAPLATPLACGAMSTYATLTAYSGAPNSTPSTTFQNGGPDCAANPPFEPSFGTTVVTPLAGAFSPFKALIERADGNRFLSGVKVDLPPGLAGMISRVQQCSDAQAAQGSCPASSQVGIATTDSGAGPNPYRLSGPAYLTGPYKGAPFGMVVVIRAIAGPFDLGTVIVRQALYVDPNDAHVEVDSDPLPRILQGIPVRLRAIEVNAYRPGFIYNPTSCAPMQVTAGIGSIQGASASRSVPFQVSGCDKLGFEPKMSMQLTGKKQTERGKHPGLKVKLTQPSGQSNIKETRATLPLALALDPDNARALCGFEQGQQGTCPAKSKIGKATAVSPALNEPLKGPVYFVQGIRIDPVTGNQIRTLPTLLVRLKGEVTVFLRASSDVKRRRLVSTFATVPDAPVSSFNMTLKGGKGGILAVVARKGICSRKQVTKTRFVGHSGKVSAIKVNMKKPCGSSNSSKGKKGKGKKS